MDRTSIVVAACSALLSLLGGRPARAQVIEVPPFALGANASQTPDVAAGTDGTMTFVWATPGDLQTVMARRFSSTGQALGPTERVDASGKVREAAISASPLGGYVVAWHYRPFNKRSLLFARRLDEGAVPLGSEAQVTTGDVPIFPEVPAVAALPSGAVVAWRQFDFVGRVLDSAGIPREQFVIGSGGAGGGAPRDIAALPDGGFLVAWRTATDGRVRLFNANGTPRGDSVSLGDFAPRTVALNPLGTLVIVSVGGDPAGVWLQRFTHAGVPLGVPVLVQGAGPTEALYPDAGMDHLDNVYVAWATYDGQLGAVGPVHARGYDAADQPLGAAIDVGSGASADTHVAALANGRFVTTWRTPFSGTSLAAVVSLCAPGASVCGDGSRHPQCETCDDGAANSDSVPDACRSDCQPAHCGDGVIDSGEECDDGNPDVCDGCTPACALEAGIVCGDGVTQPNCGETCDDANAVGGDGCSPTCGLERVPGGGSLLTDCYAEWTIDNPTNVPLLDKRGAFSNKQRCVDDDPLCDHDSGVPGSCTFHVRVCVNDTDGGACTPPNRLASWSLEKPSAKQAATNASLAAVRAVLATVPSFVVGPSTANLCTPELAVVVPLRGLPGAYRAGKLTLRTRATSYDGTSDSDKLQLTCMPAPS